MLTHLADTISQLILMIKSNMHFSFIIIGFLWGLNVINWLTGSFLNYFGILPRHPFGAIGIIFSPLLHANSEHLFFNSIPLFILLCLLPVYGQTVFIKMTIFIVLVSGSLTWVMGRKAIHIGASGLIMGYWSFLIYKAYQAPSLLSILLAALTLYYLGSLILNIFPQSEKTSWEGHLFGFLAGIAAAYIW